VAIGEIVRPHGLRGEVRVVPLSDDPARLEGVHECVLWDAVRDDRRPGRIVGARPHGTAFLVTLEGIESVEAAGGVVGRLLALPEAEARPLPPGQFYPWQLEGCQVVTEAGAEVGRVVRIEGSPAQDLWVVADGEREHLVPAVPEIVLDVDLARQLVVIRPPDGLLDL
jgi:16S rRNA processing protein RimM